MIPLSKKPFRLSALRYWVLGGVVALMVLIAWGWMLAPSFIKSTVEKAASQALQRSVRIEAVTLNVRELEIRLSGIAVKNAAGTKEALGLESLNVQLDAKRLRGPWAGEVTLSGFRWHDENGQLMLAAKSLQLPMNSIDPSKNIYAFGALRIEGLKTDIHRGVKGDINLLTSLNLWLAGIDRALAEKPKGEADSSLPLQWSLAGIEWRGGNLQFADLAAPLPQQINVQQLLIGSFNHDFMHQPLAVNLAAQVNNAPVSVSGTLQLQPMLIDVQVDVAGLPLKPIQVYFEHHLNLALKDGLLDAKGQVHIELPVKAKPKVSIQADASLRNFSSVDVARAEDFLSWKALTIHGINLNLGAKARDSVQIASVDLDDFFARVIVSSDGQLNVLNLVRKTADQGNAPTDLPQLPAAKTESPTIEVGKVNFHRGRVLFSDRFIKPKYTAKIEQVNGSIQGLSSEPDRLAEMRLTGRYNQMSPVMVKARINPLADKSFLDLTADVSNIELTSLNPYAGRYAGYNIEKGKLSLNLGYKLENGQLKAENHIFLDQLTFGDKVDSPQATSLPVRLAVALLKNRKGEIDINLPISGSLDDPQFSVGSIIWKVLGNLIVKAVTAPFSFIASMFDGGDELSSLEFQPGSAEISAENQKKLRTLCKALEDRPGLHVEMTGFADVLADGAAVIPSKKEAKRLPTNEDLLRLAQRRAQAVQLWMVDQGGIANERVFLLPAKLGSETTTVSNARVDFSLR